MIKLQNCGPGYRVDRVYRTRKGGGGGFRDENKRHKGWRKKQKVMPKIYSNHKIVDRVAGSTGFTGHKSGVGGWGGDRVVRVAFKYCYGDLG